MEEFKVSQAESFDVEYFETLIEAKNYVDKYRESHSLDYGNIIRIKRDGQKEEEVGYYCEYTEDWECEYTDEWDEEED